MFKYQPKDFWKIPFNVAGLLTVKISPSYETLPKVEKTQGGATTWLGASSSGHRVWGLRYRVTVAISALPHYVHFRACHPIPPTYEALEYHPPL